MQLLEQGRAPRLIDVREPDEFTEGHIPGAENYPISRFVQTYGELPKGEPLVLICLSGSRSEMAQQFLVGQGYQRTLNLTGGMLEWTGPIST